MHWQIALLSKTFLLGEYLVLKTGSALLLMTAPYFELSITSKIFPEVNQIESIHPSSPAGRYLKLHQDFFQNYHLNFYDPHQGQGGFGASSAQFAAVALFKWCIDHPEQTLSNEAIFKILEDYQRCAWNGEGWPPSGADVAAQLLCSQIDQNVSAIPSADSFLLAPQEKMAEGRMKVSTKEGPEEKICLFDRQQQKLTSYQNLFPDLTFSLLRTGHKIATHEHLQTLKTIPHLELDMIMQQALAAITQKNSSQFIEAIKAYAKALQQFDLVAPSTEALLAKISQLPYVLAAKGCGALGADVVLVLTTKENAQKFKIWVDGYIEK